jgi:ribose transport system ATP-binding protein
MYVLLRKLAEGGATIIFYSTDYDELIGCCDRVLVMYDGAVKRELVGEEITEHALIASALNIAPGEANGGTRGGPRMGVS